MNMKFLNKTLLMAAATFALAACAGNAPAPATDVQPEASAPASDAGTAPEQSGDATQPQKQDAAPAEPQATSDNQAVAFDSQPLDSYRLNTPDNIPVANTDTIPTTEQPVPARTRAPDPYTAFPALAAQVFAYADSLYAAGLTDSASAYLERFRIIKPLWSTWVARVDSLLNMFGKFRAEKAKAFEPLVLQIQNMIRAQSAYSMVAETADSLMALAPGDSLVRWAQQQKATAYKITLTKAKKEYASIKALADDQAQFSEALNKANAFLLRYRDFENDLHIQALIDYIAGLSAANDSEAAKYWESHDPAEALAKADELIKNSKYAKAKEILNKLKSSKLRKEANEKYQELANTFCNAQRKATSQIFTKAQKQKDDAKKKKLLQDAIAPLDKCLGEYPEYGQKQKVLDNKQFLEKEIAK
ncbi:MAG: hypothetical protein IK012_11995 [Fibrobacter sp.]|uniref:hypothetical protein n=1 Tax=Fibrobacter sp. TaxID=35828 RepID=UPI0025BA6207|nr:hypothetical protein [Fibrobacter sp.]MBR4785953.1 hypothetical protein [Fibrobacter sp.]